MLWKNIGYDSVYKGGTDGDTTAEDGMQDRKPCQLEWCSPPKVTDELNVCVFSKNREGEKHNNRFAAVRVCDVGPWDRKYQHADTVKGNLPALQHSYLALDLAHLAPLLVDTISAIASNEAWVVLLVVQFTKYPLKDTGLRWLDELIAEVEKNQIEQNENDDDGPGGLSRQKSKTLWLTITIVIAGRRGEEGGNFRRVCVIGSHFGAFFISFKVASLIERNVELAKNESQSIHAGVSCGNLHT